MKDVAGYVFVASFDPGFQHIFGRSVEPNCKYQNLKSNGIQPYSTKEEAQEGAKEFEKKVPLRRIKIGTLEMHVAECIFDFGGLMQKNPLVVVASMGGEKELYGPKTIKGPAINGKLLGDSLVVNGLRPFLSSNGQTAYEQAEEMAKQINEQAPQAATIATFNMHFL